MCADASLCGLPVQRYSPEQLENSPGREFKLSATTEYFMFCGYSFVEIMIK